MGATPAAHHRPPPAAQLHEPPDRLGDAVDPGHDPGRDGACASSASACAPPITSWGVLLNEAQNINVVALYPWLMLPVVPVILVVLAFNFLGDGLRDAADPYN